MREERLAQAFVEFSDTLVRDYDVVEFLSRLCQRSVEVLEVTAAGALLTDGAKRLQVVAASTEQVTVLETLQIQRQEGPCVDAYRSGRRVAVPDLRRVGLSATIADPQAYRSWLAPNADASLVDLITGDPGAEPHLRMLIPESKIPWAGHSGRHAARF